MSLSVLGKTPTLEELAAMVGHAPSNSPTPAWERALVSLGQSLGGHINNTPFMQVADSGDWAGAGKTAADILMRDVLGRDPETGEQGLPGVGLAGMTVFHGSPHKWMPEPGFPQGRPRLDKLGTGEGAQVYRRGIYFAEEPQVARSYRDSLSPGWKDSSEYRYKGQSIEDLSSAAQRRQAYGEAAVWENVLLHGTRDTIMARFAEDAAEGSQQAIDAIAFAKKLPDEVFAKPTGALYSLDLPDEAVPGLLDWDLPLWQQGENIKVATQDLVNPYDNTGADAMLALQQHARDMAIIRGQNAATTLGASQGAAAEALSSLGVPGVKYWDGLSRGAGEGTRNFVVWDQDWLDRMPILGVE